jgi:hypothetical protein
MTQLKTRNISFPGHRTAAILFHVALGETEAQKTHPQSPQKGETKEAQVL